MAADLHIHVIPNETRTCDVCEGSGKRPAGDAHCLACHGAGKHEPPSESDFAVFFSNALGSKWFNPRTVAARSEDDERAFDRVAAAPDMWIGEVSWLKAALFDENPEAFVPSAVEKIQEIIGEELPVIDDALISAIDDAMRGPNATSYEVAKPDDVRAFLEKHKGLRCFTVSW